MIVKNISQVGNHVIRSKSAPVRNALSREAQRTVVDLIDSITPHNLIGIAAPQIGRGLRIFVTKIGRTVYRDPKSADRLRVFINPRIIHKSKKSIYIWEGCGSVGNAGLFALVKRPETVTVEALDKNGKKFVLKTGGLLARVIQHEYDHLDGKVFLDRDFDAKSLMSKNEYYLAAKRALRSLRESKTNHK